MNDLREWLLSKLSDSVEIGGDDELILGFIRQIDAQDAELADLKQRLLPQFLGRAQRAEHERDALLEQLIAARSATGEPLAWLIEYAACPDDKSRIAHTHNAIGDYRQIDPKATSTPLYAAPQVEERATDRPDWAQQLPGAEIFDRAARVECGYDRTASYNAGYYVCLCGGACSNYTTREKP